MTLLDLTNTVSLLTSQTNDLTTTVETLENKFNCITINLKIAEYKTLIDEYQLLTKSEDENKNDLLEDKLNEINICKDEKVPYTDLNNLIERYMWDKRPPLRDDVVDILEVKPKIRERKNIAERVITKIVDFVNVFVEGMDI